MNTIIKVKLENFRTHDSFTLDLKNPTTLVVGENGSGKTSLIEALYVTIQGKSFRSRDVDILKNSKKHYKVVTFFGDGRKNQVEFDNDTGKKTFTLDDKRYHRLPAKHKYPVVLFEPDDLNLLYDAPSKRRDWLNRLISVFSAEYHTSLLRYEKALSQRNSALKRDFCGRDDVFAWDVLLAKYGSRIMELRQGVIQRVNGDIQGVYKSIAGNDDQIGAEYQSDVVDESGYLKKLEASFDKDRILGQTTFGPHRDDVVFGFNGNLAVNVASRGEVRTIVLALKFIEARLIEEQLGLPPIVLLDDIFSELDGQRQNHLVNNFKDNQVIITSVNPPADMSEDVSLQNRS
ncbi:MAG: DNA replication and repair protein RecF [Candidatus Nomurabacteria bacterium]|jgi:DNA replication and repair protein RecF|nr:DNA replication and repair protein RecF [Candidatus Nomurabacteria bacterium]